MAVAAYGASNPAGTDPWPIESVIAQEALKGNSSAHAMLADYRMAREADTNLYNQSMVGQHEFAKQQLIAQMQEARNKLIPELVGKPGGGAFLAGGGIEGVGPGAGGNAAAWAGLGQAGQQHDFATNLAETGKGVESLSRAGQDLPIQQISGLQNAQTTGAGEHSDISVEKIKAATALQTAAMHAKAKAAGAARAPGETMQVTDPVYGTPKSITRPRGYTDAQWNAWVQSHTNLRPIDPQAQPQALPDPGGAAASLRSTPASSRVPGLGNASSAPARGSVPNNAGAGVAAAQQQVLASMDKMRGHPAYPDLVAGMKANGGKPIVKIENGSPVLYGASGNPI